MLRVSADAIVKLTVDARNKRDLIDLPGGKVTVAFRARHFWEFGLSPEGSLKFGLHHPDGVPVPSGAFYPSQPAAAAADSDDLVRAAFSIPSLENAFAPHVQTVGGRFLVDSDWLDAAQFAERINRRLAELPGPPRLKGPTTPSC